MEKKFRGRIAMTRLRFIQNKTKFKVEVFVLVVLKGASRLDFEEKLKISPFYFILNDTRIHLVSDHISFFRLIIHAPLKNSRI